MRRIIQCRTIGSTMRRSQGLYDSTAFTSIVLFPSQTTLLIIFSVSIYMHLFRIDDFDNPTSFRRCHSGCILLSYASRSCVKLRKAERIGYAFWNMLSCHSFAEYSSTHMNNVFRCSTVFTDSSTIYPALGPTLIMKDYVERPSLMSSAELHYRDTLKRCQSMISSHFSNALLGCSFNDLRITSVGRSVFLTAFQPSYDKIGHQHRSCSSAIFWSINTSTTASSQMV